jgi:hypothetical protein
VALLVWLLLVLIDGGLSLRRLLHRQAEADGSWPWPSRRRAGGGSCVGVGPVPPGSLSPLVRVMAADQPAVAIS